jgi:hypothetical protein
MDCDKGEEEQRKFRELWVVNFVLNFGAPHLKHRDIPRLYSNQTGRDLLTDVETFSGQLKMKAQFTPVVNILTINHQNDTHRPPASENFLKPLSATHGYEALQQPRTFSEVLGSIKNETRYYLENIAKARSDRHDWPRPYPHEFRLLQVETLPIQLLIVKLLDGRYRCLVFMVGTEILLAKASQEAKTGQELNTSGDVQQHAIGFYTELDAAVDVYKGLARALMSQTIEDPCRRYGTNNLDDELKLMCQKFGNPYNYEGP